MRILVLNDSQSELEAIKSHHPHDEICWASRYLQFLHALEDGDWDAIYLDDDISDIDDPDVWVDGNGIKKNFTGIHAARGIATLAEIGKNPAKKIIVTGSSPAAVTMLQILKDKIEVSKIKP